jgi:hypothetical protein
MVICHFDKPSAAGHFDEPCPDAQRGGTRGEIFLQRDERFLPAFEMTKDVEVTRDVEMTFHW